METVVKDTVDKDVPSNNGKGIAIGLLVFILILALAQFIFSLYGGKSAIKKCHKRLGICAIVFTFVFPPLGFILACVGFALNNECPKSLPLIQLGPLSTLSSSIPA